MTNLPAGVTENDFDRDNEIVKCDGCDRPIRRCNCDDEKEND